MNRNNTNINFNRNLSELSLQNKVDQFIKTLTNQTKKRNNANRRYLIKNSLYTIRNQMQNDDLTNLKKMQKLIIAFLKIYNNIRKITTIKQDIVFTSHQNLNINLKITHNTPYLEAILDFNLDEKIITIQFIENNTDIKTMFYFVLLYVNYVLFILLDMNIAEMFQYQIHLTATPEACNIMNVSKVSTNNKRLYEYYESYGFIAVNENIRRNRQGSQIGTYTAIPYFVEYDDFIHRIYDITLELMEL